MAEKTIRQGINFGPLNIKWFNRRLSFPFIIFCFSLVLYSASVFNGYNLDDELVTLNHKLTSQGLKGIPEIFTSPYYSDDMGYAYDYRPIVHLSFALEHQFFGEHAWISHCINIFLYAWCCILVFTCLKRIPGLSSNFSFCVALLFVAFPSHTEIVCSIKNRDEILALGFCLGSFAIAQNYIVKTQPLLLLWLFAIYTFSLLSKYSAISFSLIIPLGLVLLYKVNWRKLIPVSLIFILPNFFLSQDVSILNRVLFVLMLAIAPYFLYLTNLPYTNWITAINAYLTALIKSALGFILSQANSVLLFFKRVVVALIRLAKAGFKTFVHTVKFVAKTIFETTSGFLRFWVAPYINASVHSAAHTNLELKNIFRFRFIVRGLVYIIFTVAGIYYTGFPYSITVSTLLLFLYYKTADDEERVWIWIAISIPALYYSATAIAIGKHVNFLSPVLFVFVLLALKESKLRWLYIFFSILLAVAIGWSINDLSFLPAYVVLVVAYKNVKLSKPVAYVFLLMLLLVGISELIEQWQRFNSHYHDPVNETIHWLGDLVLCWIIIRQINARKTITVYFAFMLIHFVSAGYVFYPFIATTNLPFNKETVVSHFKKTATEPRVAVAEPKKIQPPPPAPPQTIAQPALKSTWPKLPTISNSNTAPLTFEILNFKSDRQLDFVESPVTRFDKLEVRISSAFVVAWFYFTKLLLPYPMAFYYGYSEFKPESLSSTMFLLSLAAHIILFTLLLWGFKKNHFLFVFALLIYFVSVFSLSGFLQRIAGVVADRFITVPSLGFCIIIVWAVYTAFKLHMNDEQELNRIPSRAKGLLLTLLVLYSGLTFARSLDWRSDLTLLRKDIRAVPNSAQAHNLLAIHLMQYSDKALQPAEKTKLTTEALYHFNQALIIYPEFYNVAYYLGKVYTQIGNADSAIAAYKRALTIDSSYNDVYLNLGNLLQSTGKNSEAIYYYQKVTQYSPSDFNGYNKLSYTYYLLNDFENSIAVNKRAARFFPTLPDPLINIGVAFQAMNKRDSAAIYLQQALTVDPTNKAAQNLLQKNSTEF